MLLTYERFGTLTLPIYDPSEPIGAFAARSSFLDLPAGGASRGYGTERAAPETRTIRRVGTLLGASLTEVDTALTALVAACRTVDRLYARRPDGALVWTMAELASVDALREPRTLFRGCPDVALTVETEFVLYAPPWYGEQHGEAWTFDSGEIFDTGMVLDQALGDVFTLSHAAPTVIEVVNAGNAPVDTVFIEVTPGAGDITAFSLYSDDGAITQADWVWNGMVPTLEALLIDAGAQSITVTNGTEVYSGMVFQPGHSISGWLRLNPGTTEITIVLASATDATMVLTFADGWL